MVARRYNGAAPGGRAAHDERRPDMPTKKTPAPVAAAAPVDAPLTPRPFPLATAAAQVLDKLRAVTAITSAEKDAEVALLHRAARDTAKAIRAHYLEERRPWREAADACKKLEDAEAAPYELEDRRVTALVTSWNAAEAARVRAEEAARQAQATAEATAQRAQTVAALDQAAEQAPTPELAQALRGQADDVAAAPLDVAPTTAAPVAAPRVSGRSVSVAQEAVVTDHGLAVASIALPLVLRHYLEPIIAHLTAGLTPPKAQKLEQAVKAAARDVVDSVAAPPPEALLIDMKLVDSLVKRSQGVVAYPGIGAQAKAGVRFR